MPYNFIKNVILNESTPSKNLELLPLPYSKGDLEPAISEDTINYHYNYGLRLFVVITVKGFRYQFILTS